MMIQRAGRVPMIGLAVLAFVLALLVCGAAIASEIERQIPMLEDTTGSGVTMEISRDGSRRTATPFLTVSEPAVQRIEDRIAKITARLEAMSTPSEETVADAVPRIGLGGTPREDSGPAQTTLSSLPPLPGEITIRNVRNFLKGVRATRKERPAPAAVAAVAAVPEQRLWMAAISPHGAN
jgi:hypothetical protein